MTHGRRAGALSLAVAFVLAVVSVGPPAAAASQAITSAGPLTRIEISDTLNCSVNHSADAAGEFFGGTACGTFLAFGGNVYGPAEIPAGENLTAAANYRPFTPVSQTAATGAGTAADPFKIVTVVDAGGTGLRITETDTYVVGQETYRTDIAVANSGAERSIVLYRAGDCFLQDSDTGFGAVDEATDSVSCVGVTPENTRGTRIEQWRPLTPGSRYMEAEFEDVWAAIATGQPLPNTCRCENNIDNGAGLSWSATVPAGGSLTFSHLTSFSPAGNQPLAMTKTADPTSVGPGGTVRYTVTVSNPNSSAVTLNRITDTLPAGFTYTSGSTSGATTANPSVDGQTLTWTGPFTVPANGNLQLQLSVVAATTAGTYANSAGAEGVNFAVVPTGDTASVTVTGGDGSTTTTTTTGSGSTTTSSSTTTSTTTTLPVVTPGAFCATQGATGVTVTGLAMVCSRTPDDERLRWRQAGGGGSGPTTATTSAPGLTSTATLALTGPDLNEITAVAALTFGAGGVLLLVGGRRTHGSRRKAAP